MQKGKYKHLTNTEREEISRCLANKQALAEIARQLGRATSTISREIYRNSG
ncbi:MAG TPA: helix-turn-helix domain-containing protein, partial [Anaerolineae bacterium]|nr:helix-turn-helix domain-containing protein [Anaerolineae bacterium]